MRGKAALISIYGLITWMTFLTAQAVEVPKLLKQYLKVDQPTKGEVFVVLPPDEINIYLDKVKEASRDNLEWFNEFSANAKPGVPLPYDERLGLSKEEYQKYRDLWDQRDFKVIQEVGIRLEETDGKFMIRVGGKGIKISLLKFDAKTGVVHSPNGEMKRIDDIDADPDSILRAWKGQEWKYENESTLGKTKENFAIGKAVDGNYGLLVYRLQDLSSTGRILYDDSVVIKFPLPKKGK